jgi:hypothetical protein
MSPWPLPDYVKDTLQIVPIESRMPVIGVAGRTVVVQWLMCCPACILATARTFRDSNSLALGR